MYLPYDPVIIFWVYAQKKGLHGSQKDMHKHIYGILMRNSYKLEIIQIPISGRLYSVTFIQWKTTVNKEWWNTAKYSIGCIVMDDSQQI